MEIIAFVQIQDTSNQFFSYSLVPSMKIDRSKIIKKLYYWCYWLSVAYMLYIFVDLIQIEQVYNTVQETVMPIMQRELNETEWSVGAEWGTGE